MDDDNPLYFLPDKNRTQFNKSGRPTNNNLIKFSPQPSSLISQMLRKLKRKKEDESKPLCKNPNIHFDDVTVNNEYENNKDTCDAGIAWESEEDMNATTEIVNKSKKTKDCLYPCDYPKCTYISKLSSNLVKHKRTHTMEKPYLCDQCSFRSNFVNSLKVHRRIHTNERPYSCKYCTYRCNSSSNLKKHCKHRHLNMK